MEGLLEAGRVAARVREAQWERRRDEQRRGFEAEVCASERADAEALRRLDGALADVNSNASALRAQLVGTKKRLRMMEEAFRAVTEAKRQTLPPAGDLADRVIDSARRTVRGAEHAQPAAADDARRRRRKDPQPPPQDQLPPQQQRQRQQQPEQQQPPPLQLEEQQQPQRPQPQQPQQQVDMTDDGRGGRRKQPSPQPPPAQQQRQQQEEPPRQPQPPQPPQPQQQLDVSDDPRRRQREQQQPPPQQQEPPQPLPQQPPQQPPLQQEGPVLPSAPSARPRTCAADVAGGARVLCIVAERCLGAWGLWHVAGCSRATSAVVDAAAFRPWTKRAHLRRLALHRRSRLLVSAERESKAQRPNQKFSASHAEFLAGVPDNRRRLAPFNEVAMLFRGAPWRRPDAKWWRNVARRQHGDAWAAAAALLETTLGVAPADEPWVAAACLLLCLEAPSDARPGAVIAAALRSLAAAAAPSDVAEFSAALYCRISDGGWDRVRYNSHQRVSTVSALARDLGNAIDLFSTPVDPRAAVARGNALTDEQESVCAAELDPEKRGVLIVKAYAGTGKTHTVLEFCRRRASPKCRIAVAYFNRGMAEETRRRLASAGIAPDVCECRTCDSFVAAQFSSNREAVAAKFADDTDDDAPPNLSTSMILEAIGVDADAPFAETIASHTRKVLTKWCLTLRLALGDEEEEAIPHVIVRWWDRHKNLLPKGKPPPLQRYARMLWRALISMAPEHAQVKLSYVEVAKAYQLRECLPVPGAAADPAARVALRWMLSGHRTVIEALEPFRLDAAFVVIDEAQDTSPTHFALFVTAHRRDAGRNVAHLLLGDAFQSLYAWRGATNALRDAQSIATLPTVTLTQSFRFGPSIAELATLLLANCSDDCERLPPLVGRGPNTTLHFHNGVDCDPHLFDPKRRGSQLVCIGRTNQAVLRAADEYARVAPPGSIFVRGLDVESERTLAKSLLRLRRDPMAVASFGDDGPAVTYARLVELARNDAIADAALRRALDGVDELGDGLLTRLDRIAAASASTPEKARVQLTTVHQFKGMQTCAVRLLDDAWTPTMRRGQPTPLRDDDRCLIYTALTRVQEHLYVNKDIRQLWLWEKPARAVLRLRLAPNAPREAEAGSEPPPECAACCSSVRPQRTRLFRAALSHQSQIEEVCRTCAGMEHLQHPFFSPLDDVRPRNAHERFLAGWVVHDEADEDEDSPTPG
ncbi:P-loop containing nucleoside triphosphate hydrolase protein [Pelagophyceae sp. CCMP2097]|nr:P-loop containing nucleoside triphosphate hydrolase protein [Pelagophyceae sp. CCMP2097]